MEAPPSDQRVIWTPQPGPQELFLKCRFEDVLYGGAAGGGKSDGLLGDYCSGIELYGSAWRGILFRKTYKNLEELERRSIEILSPVYGIDCYKRGRTTWEIPSFSGKGTATLQLRALEAEIDVYKYQGHQFSWIGFDELTHWGSDWYIEYLFTRLRSAQGAPCYMRAATNPGNIGHSWVKERYGIGTIPGMTPIPFQEGGEVRHRCFIPAKLTDNKILMANDRTYMQRLDSIPDPALRRALRDGDWDIVSGAAFPEFDKKTHICMTYRVPTGVPIWRAMDWGYEKPYCVLWGYADFDGNVVICGELYGKGRKSGMGSREDEEIVRDKIIEMERMQGWQVTEAWLDPQCWAEHGSGQTQFEKLGGYQLGWRKWPKGPGSRLAQKAQIHSLLRVTNGVSRLRIMDCCTNLIRTLQSIPLDSNGSGDVDTHAEDHAYDTLRGIVAKRVHTKVELDELARLKQIMRIDQARSETQFGGW